MGQTFPLPERIPTPTDEQRSELVELGIKVGDVDAENSQYVSIVLPDTLMWINNSEREDLPDWNIVRKDTQMAIVTVSGSWKETYDNQLWIRVHKEEKINFVDKPPEPSTTSGDAKTREIMSAILTDANARMRPKEFVNKQ